DALFTGSTSSRRNVLIAWYSVAFISMVHSSRSYAGLASFLRSFITAVPMGRLIVSPQAPLHVYFLSEMVKPLSPFTTTWNLYLKGTLLLSNNGINLKGRSW